LRTARPPEQSPQLEVEHLEVAPRDARRGDAMTMRTVEAAGPAAARAAGVDEAPAGLSWTAFGERYFPGRRRHDFEVLTAFAKYLAAEG
jgi:hypothetical protein